MSYFDEKADTPVVWSIGGIDPTGLAGISADNRAIAASGSHGVNIITSVTAQNSNAFLSQHEISIDELEQQWIALSEQCKALSQCKPVIKIGLLISPVQVKWLGDKLCQLKNNNGHNQLVWVIYDPVLRASSDDEQVPERMLAAVKTHLLPWVDLLTPNLPEALLLSETLSSSLLVESDQPEDLLLKYTTQLSNEFNCQVLLKGGHVDDLFNGDVKEQNKEQGKEKWCFDYYARCELTTEQPADRTVKYVSEPAHQFVLKQPFNTNKNRRGSGCILASLIAGFVANDYTFCDAILLSNGVMAQAYKNAKPLGVYAGGALMLTSDIHHEDLPVIKIFNGATTNHFVKPEHPFWQCPDRLGLYPVVDSVEWIERLLKQGIKTIQLRVKSQQFDGDIQTIESSIKQAIVLGKQYKARVFINDYWSLAIKHGAYGVHLGQEDLHSADLNAIKNAGLRLGLSTHGIFEAQWASQFKPSYMAIGHIYATQTKDMPSRPQGLAKLHTQVAIFDSKLPLVAIGGITESRASDVVKSNIASVALVTAITKADNPDEVTESLIALVGQGAIHE